MQGFSKDLTSSPVLHPSNEDASTLSIHDRHSSNVPQSTSLESLRDDTFLLPLDFEIPPETEPRKSSPSTAITEVVAAIHERCTHVAAKRVAEMEDGSWREAPGVPEKTWIRKTVKKHATDVLPLLQDDEVRGSVLDDIDGHWQYVALDHAKRLTYVTLRCAEAVNAARDKQRERLLRQRTEDETTAKRSRQDHRATFSDLVRIEDGAEEPNCRLICWNGADPRSSWVNRSPVVVAAWTATGLSSEMPNCLPPVVELAQRIIDANSDAIREMKRRKREIDEEWDRKTKEKSRQDQAYVGKWLPKARIEEAWADPKLRRHLIERARERERKYEREEEAARRRDARTPGESAKPVRTKADIMAHIAEVKERRRSGAAV